MSGSVDRVKGASNAALNLDEALAYIGEFGLGQRLQLCVSGLAWALVGLYTVLTLASNLGQNPITSGRVECVHHGDLGQKCQDALHQPYPLDLCSLDRDQWRWKSQGWSLVSEYDLVCGKTWLVYFSAGLFFLGMLLGCIVWQVSAERYSRRRLLYSSCLVTGIASALAATAPSLWLHTLFRTLIGAGTGCMALSSYILATDVVGPSWRGIAILALHTFFSLGGLTASLLVMWIPSWRGMLLLSALLTLGYITTWSFIAESPHWLLLKGKKGDATAAIAAIAFTNRSRPPERPLADPIALLANPNRSFGDVMRNNKLSRTTITAASAWFVASAAYIAVAMMSSGLSNGDAAEADGSTLELLATGFAYEIPGIAAAALAVERLGRRYTVLAGFLQAASCCLVAGFTSADAQRALAVGSRFGLAAALSSLHLHTSELFPVVVQHVGLAATNYAGRVGAVAAPALPLLAAMLGGNRVTLLVCGCLCACGAVLAAMLPETSGTSTYETIQDMSSAMAVKRHRTWSGSLRAVFRPQASPGPAVFGVAERNV